MAKYMTYPNAIATLTVNGNTKDFNVPNARRVTPIDDPTGEFWLDDWRDLVTDFDRFDAEHRGVRVAERYVHGATDRKRVETFRIGEHDYRFATRLERRGSGATGATSDDAWRASADHWRCEKPNQATATVRALRQCSDKISILLRGMSLEQFADFGRELDEC